MLSGDLVLVVMLQPIRILAIAAIGGSARWLHIRGVPGLRAEAAQESGRVKGAGAYFGVERLDQHAALAGPVLLQAQDDVLKSRAGHGGSIGCVGQAADCPTSRLLAAKDE
jgi:hypothetical protein